MKKEIGIVLLIATISGCNTVATRAETAALEYTAPEETSVYRNQMRPGLTAWCDDYLELMQGGKLTCDMVSDDVLGFYTSIDQQHFRWSKPGIRKFNDNFADWACDALANEIQAGYAVITHFEGSPITKTITQETCDQG